MKILWTTNIPSPYRVDFFNVLAKYLNLKVVFESNEEAGRNKNWYSNNFCFQYKFLTNFSFLSVLSFLIKELKLDYDCIIITNYNTKFSIACKFIAKLYQKKVVLVIDGGIIKSENFIKKNIKKFLISNFDLYLGTGKEAKKYLTYYGANVNKIRFYHFSSFTKEQLNSNMNMAGDKQELKKKLKIKESKVVLSVGRFIKLKGFDILLKSIYDFEDVAFFIIGGEVNEEYKKIIEENHIKNVYFLNHMSTKKLNEYYLCADIFVLPTRSDVWGLVINEAMSFGLPVITTTSCVAGMELVDSNYLYDAEDFESLHDLIASLIHNNDEMKKQSERNLDKIADYNIETMALDTYNALKKFK